jgi:hypothetical protein
VAALYDVYADRVSELYRQVQSLATETEDAFVKETAAWVVQRLDLGGATD